MNRRGFFGAVLAVPLAVAIPRVAERKQRHPANVGLGHDWHEHGLSLDVDFGRTDQAYYDDLNRRLESLAMSFRNHVDARALETMNGRCIVKCMGRPR